MEHHFNVDLANEFGINAAIILNHLAFWIKKNIANNRNIHDGRYWTYSSVKAMQELFPYLSKNQITKALKDLEDAGIIEIGNFNKQTYDRTKWYTFTDKGVQILTEKGFHFWKPEMDLPKSRNGFTQNQKPIPYNKTYNKPYITNLLSNTKQDSITNLPKERVTNQVCDERARKLAIRLHNWILKNKPNRKIEPNWENNWSYEIDKMNRIDKRSWADITAMIDWSQQNDFWKKNILSGAKLRKQFDRLEDERESEKKNEFTVIDLNKYW